MLYAFAAVCFTFFFLLSITAVPRRRLPLPREVVMVSLIRFELDSFLYLSKHEFIYVVRSQIMLRLIL